MRLSNPLRLDQHPIDAAKSTRATIRQWVTGLLTPDSPRTLFFVHVGKTGGTTVEAALRESPVIRGSFSRVKKIHTFSPPIHSQSRYLLTLRNPIARALSAFNWRYDLLVSRKIERSYWAGEKEVLERYGSLGHLAECLVSNGRIVQRVAQDYRAIHHLREGYGMYLSGIVSRVDSSQIFALLPTNQLNTQLPPLLGLAGVFQKRVTPRPDLPEQSTLSALARKNLRLFLDQEFALLERLISMIPEAEPTRKQVLGE